MQIEFELASAAIVVGSSAYAFIIYNAAKSYINKQTKILRQLEMLIQEKARNSSQELELFFEWVANNFEPVFLALLLEDKKIQDLLENGNFSTGKFLNSIKDPMDNFKSVIINNLQERLKNCQENTVAFVKKELENEKIAK